MEETVMKVLLFEYALYNSWLFQDVNGQVGGGGVSIHYSHALQLLFFSYSHGKSFIAPLKCMDSGLPVVFMINLGKTGSNGNKANNAQPQPLCQWSEVPNHPGLVCSVMQTSKYYRFQLYRIVFS
jgi:E3 ubiquitin-protein ligase UBR4